MEPVRRQRPAHGHRCARRASPGRMVLRVHPHPDEHRALHRVAAATARRSPLPGCHQHDPRAGGVGMSGITIVPVVGRRQVGRFVEFPYTLYASYPHWVPPLRRDEHRRLSPAHNPFLEHAEMALWIAEDRGRVVGRIAAIDDRLHNEKHQERTTWLGFFEAENPETARPLLAAVEAWGKARGSTVVRGPANPSLNESAGLLVDAFDQDPYMMMPYNPPTYPGFLEESGYRKLKDLLAWGLNVEAGMGARIEKLAHRIRKRHGITIRRVDMRNFDRDLEYLLTIYRAAWQDNWGFVPPTDAEIRQTAAEMKPVIDPDIALFAEREGRPVACALAIPDVNQVLKRMNGRLLPFGIVHFLRRRHIITRARVVLAGVLPEVRHMGLYPLLVDEIYRRGSVRYRETEMSWTLEDNDEVNKGIVAAGVGKATGCTKRRCRSTARRGRTSHVPDPGVGITGVTGFLGWHLAEAFRDAGWRVVGVVRPGSSKAVPEGIARTESPLEADALSRVARGLSVVIHAAGLTSGSAADPGDGEYQGNGGGRRRSDCGWSALRLRVEPGGGRRRHARSPCAGRRRTASVECLRTHQARRRGCGRFRARPLDHPAPVIGLWAARSSVPAPVQARRARLVPPDHDPRHAADPAARGRFRSGGCPRGEVRRERYVDVCGPSTRDNRRRPAADCRPCGGAAVSTTESAGTAPWRAVDGRGYGQEGRTTRAVARRPACRTSCRGIRVRDRQGARDPRL